MGDDDPFGINLRSLGDKDSHRYTGQILDEDQSLYYYGARYFSPEIGRFLSVDPMRQYDSGYLYAANRPIEFIDPDGQLSGGAANFDLLKMAIITTLFDPPVTETTYTMTLTATDNFAGTESALKGANAIFTLEIEHETKYYWFTDERKTSPLGFYRTIDFDTSWAGRTIPTRPGATGPENGTYTWEAWYHQQNKLGRHFPTIQFRNLNGSNLLPSYSINSNPHATVETAGKMLVNGVNMHTFSPKSALPWSIGWTDMNMPGAAGVSEGCQIVPGNPYIERMDNLMRSWAIDKLPHFYYLDTAANK